MRHVVGLKALPASLRRVLLCVALALALGAVMCTASIAAPRATSPQQCVELAFVASLARALAAEGIERELAVKVIGHLAAALNDEAEAAFRLILAAAYGTPESAEEFATRIAQACIRRQGDLGFLEPS